MKKQIIFYVLLMCTIHVVAQDQVSYGNRQVSPLFKNDLTRAKRVPKPFEPIVLNPANGQDLPDPVKLPDGSTMPRDKYLAELNKVEQALNRQGLSLRDNEKVVLIHALKNKLAKSQQLIEIEKFSNITIQLNDIVNLKYTALNTQAPMLYNDNNLNNGYVKSDLQKKDIKETKEIKINEDLVYAALAKETKLVIDKIAPFEFTYGDAETLGASAFAKYELTSKAEPLADVKYATATPATVTEAIKKTNSDFKMYIGTEGSFSVLGYKVKLFEASFTLDAPSNPTKNLNKRIIVERLGKTIFNLDEQYNGDTKEIDKTDEDVVAYKMKDIVIPIAGPINITTSFSVTGKMGVQYKCSLNRYGLSAGVMPFVKAKAILEASIGLGSIASIGVGGELKLINAEVKAGVNAGLSWNATGWQLNNTSLLNMNLTLLKGRLYAFAELDLWVKTIRWEHDFYNYDGIEFNKSIINHNNSISFKDWRKVMVVDGGGINGGGAINQ
jgi:hypothetical protein